MTNQAKREMPKAHKPSQRELDPSFLSSTATAHHGSNRQEQQCHIPGGVWSNQCAARQSW
jgi:hypothetical protein